MEEPQVQSPQSRPPLNRPRDRTPRRVVSERGGTGSLDRRRARVRDRQDRDTKSRSSPWGGDPHQFTRRHEHQDPARYGSSGQLGHAHWSPGHAHSSHPDLYGEMCRYTPTCCPYHAPPPHLATPCCRCHEHDIRSYHWATPHKVQHTPTGILTTFCSTNVITFLTCGFVNAFDLCVIYCYVHRV